MDGIKRGVITLIKSAITGEPYPLPEGFVLRDVAIMMKRLKLLPLGYAGAVNCGIDQESKTMQKMQELYMLEYLTSSHQLQQLQQLFDTFEEKGIEYMPLKGTILKQMYPSHEMRAMCDGDVLIHAEQRQLLQSIMEQLGYTPLSESDHEWNWAGPELKVELHKRLVSSDDKDYYSYFGEGWQFAKTRQGCRWAMSKEDAFVFEFAHFARHYCTNGVNVRHILDLWIHMRSSENLDKQYIRDNLAKMELEVFYDNIMTLIKAWFYDGPWDERTEFISDYIFSGGVTKAISDRARLTQNTGRAGKSTLFVKRMFPSKQHIIWSYPRLEKWPLPLAWVARWWLLLTVRRKQREDRQQEMENVSEEAVQEHLKGMQYAGIKFSR